MGGYYTTVQVIDDQKIDILGPKKSVICMLACVHVCVCVELWVFA